MKTKIENATKNELTSAMNNSGGCLKNIQESRSPRSSRPAPNTEGDYLEPVGMIGGKPAFVVPTTTVLNTKSGFGHKQLCDHLTFTAGSVCAYSCTYCYVGCVLRKNGPVNAILKHNNCEFSDVVVRRADAVGKIHKALLSRGKPKYTDPNDRRVIYGSPLVDIAATMELARETLQMCLLILEHTAWHIRLLSKSPLLGWIADQIPAEWRNRMIFGFSTGTINDRLARAIEVGTPSVSKRLEALHRLQDRAFRTFGMCCPILPQADPKAYACRLAQEIRVDRCEHVWAEVLNVRDSSMTKTCAALGKAGFSEQANLLEQVSHDRDAWERYSREMFVALAEVIPPGKLRFLQYVRKDTAAWWRGEQHRGAVLLGRGAQKEN